MQCDTLVAVFGRCTDLLSADMGVRIIHRSTDFYIVTKIYGWGANYIPWRIIFKVLWYSPPPPSNIKFICIILRATKPESVLQTYIRIRIFKDVYSLLIL